MQSCLAISGYKNAGKTTLIERLIPRLTEVGLKVGVIKHDGHEYTADTPGTDSFRFFEAGAYASAVYDRQKFTVTKREAIDEEKLLSFMAGADIVLLEGAKHTDYPKLEVIRGELRVMEGLRGRLAFISDLPGLPADADVFRPEDIKKITEFILSKYESRVLTQRFG